MTSKKLPRKKVGTRIMPMIFLKKNSFNLTFEIQINFPLIIFQVDDYLIYFFVDISILFEIL